MANRMNRYAKMTLAANRGTDRPEYETRRMDRYNSGRYGPMRNDTNIEIEGRFRDDRVQQRENEYRMTGEPESRRRRDSLGRFRSEWDDGMENNWREGSREMESNYPNRPFPVYQNEPDMRYRGERMNQIGFMNRENEVNTNYRMAADYNAGNEMEHHSSQKMGGGASSYESMPMTKEIAEEWTAGMRNEDGTKGPHWTMDQARQAMAQKGVNCDPVEMFVILNALYSDYCAVLKKYGMNKMDVYVDLACAWLNDKDAVKNKASAYYEHIVKK